MISVSIWRLNLLRAGYLLLILGLGPLVWPEILFHLEPGERAVVASMLGAMSLLALVGLRYPLQMLPLLIFELTWKVIWLLMLALPLWSSGRMDAATAERAAECLVAVVYVALIPWRYVVEAYVKRSADAWRRVPTRAA